MQNGPNDKYPEKFNFNEEVLRVKIQFGLMLFAEMEEAIFNESEPEDTNDEETSPMEVSSEDSDRHI